MPDPVGQISGTQESLSDWAAPYVTDIIGKVRRYLNSPIQPIAALLRRGNRDYKPKLIKALQDLLSQLPKWERLPPLRLRLAILPKLT